MLSTAPLYTVSKKVESAACPIVPKVIESGLLGFLNCVETDFGGLEDQ